ncbi:adhesive plaque matrix protein [Procambarus clarkii]|uniref:adhesive plaque matrix protein n=1 Tax=Procambarus clarkii TaxID=6728 RepID=UPI003743CCF4
MALKNLLVASVAVLAMAEPPPRYPDPTPYAPVPSYPSHSRYPKEEYQVILPKYAFNYGVSDEYSGTNFGHSEVRDGYKTEGSYSVDLPDGRKQIVNYVDNGDGLEAQVTYEGEAHYPEYKPEYQPAPVYKPKPAYSPYEPEPVYKPAPAYKPVPTYRPAPSYEPIPKYPTPIYEPAPTYKPVSNYPPPAYEEDASYPPPAYKPAPSYPPPAYGLSPSYPDLSYIPTYLENSDPDYNPDPNYA